MSTRLFSLLATVMLSACSAEPAPLITVTNARVMLLPSSGVAYFDLTNSGGSDRLVKVAAPQLGAATIHETRMDETVMRMRPVDTPIDVHAGGKVAFSPRGLHVMILRDSAASPTGERTQLVLSFARQGDVTVEALLDRGAGEEQ